MSREKEDYRANLERLNELFPEREMLTVGDVMRVYGIKSYHLAHKIVKFTAGRVSKATLARVMCG